MMGMLGPSLWAPLHPVPHPPLGFLPWACWGLSVPFKVLGPPLVLGLPQISQQKPPFAWLWNKQAPGRVDETAIRPVATAIRLHLCARAGLLAPCHTISGPAPLLALPPMWPPLPPSTEGPLRGWRLGDGLANLSGLCLSWTSVLSEAGGNT